MSPKEHFSNQPEMESPEKAMAWTIDGSPERTTEAIEMAIRHLEASGWSGERLEDIKETLSVGIANTVAYANHGDAAKSIEIGLSIYDAEDGKKIVEISLTGQDKAVEGPADAPVPTGEEADLQGARAGDLFVKLPSGVDVTLFPEENKIILKQNPEVIAE